MISHVVLMTPRPDLSAHDRGALIAALRRALEQIPSVRSVRIGRRIRHGAGYESPNDESGSYAAIIDFDSLDGLRAYLAHPAHDDLGKRFYECLKLASVYDYEVGGIELLDRLS
jgi:hypothetical protein